VNLGQTTSGAHDTVLRPDRLDTFDGPRVDDVDPFPDEFLHLAETSLI
jgi:hypothetical protein